MKRKVLKIGLFTVMIITMVLVSTLDFDELFFKRTSKDDTNYDSVVENTDFLGRVKNKSQLIELLSSSSGNNYYYGRFAINESADMDGIQKAPQANKDVAAGGNSEDISQTNNQVEGVDEADIIKTDGEYVYYVSERNIFIVDAKDPKNLSLASKIAFKDNERPIEIFLDGNKMAVIFNSYDEVMEKSVDPGAIDKLVMPSIWYGNEYTTIRIYDISNKSTVAIDKEFSFDGSYTTSRKINNQIYLIGNKYNYYTPYIYNYYGEIIGFSEVDDFIPRYKDTTQSNKFNAVEVNDISYFKEDDATNYICIASIDINDSKKPAEFQTYLGSGYNVYASADNIYVVGTTYKETKADVVIPGPTIVPEVEPSSSIAPSQNPNIGRTLNPDTTFGTIEPSDGLVSTTAPVAEPTLEPGAGTSVFVNSGLETVIYKFDIDDGNINGIAKGTVPGSIINQFSMDESNGYFRIATTTQNVAKNYLSENNIYVLDSELIQVGKVTGLAPDESIYSVRFMGDKAYMVTFKTMDPLFVIDLSNPKAPKVLGELKIPGFSNYLHPYDETHIIGFGRDTDEVEPGFAQIKGLKVAMFDVSDVNNPKEMFKFNIGGSGTYSELLNDHKALMYSRSKNLMGFPVSIWGNGGDSYQGFYVYDIDLESGFNLKGRVSHFDLDQNASKIMYSYVDVISRGIYIDDTLFTVSPNKIAANDLESLTFLDDLKLE